MCENTMNSKQYEEEIISIEKDRFDTYTKDVISAMQDRANSERYRNNIEILTKEQQKAYNKMVYLVFMQTLLMVAQTLLFAGIYFKL